MQHGRVLVILILQTIARAQPLSTGWRRLSEKFGKDRTVCAGYRHSGEKDLRCVRSAFRWPRSVGNRTVKTKTRWFSPSQIGLPTLQKRNRRTTSGAAAAAEGRRDVGGCCLRLAGGIADERKWAASLITAAEAAPTASPYECWQRNRLATDCLSGYQAPSRPTERHPAKRLYSQTLYNQSRPVDNANRRHLTDVIKLSTRVKENEARRSRPLCSATGCICTSEILASNWSYGWEMATGPFSVTRHDPTRRSQAKYWPNTTNLW